MSSDDFPTREQEAVISRLAIEHGGVRIDPRGDDNVVHLSFHHVPNVPDVWLDEDGHDVSAQHYREPPVYFELPVDLVCDLIGREAYNAALWQIKRGTTYESISLGSILATTICERVRALLEDAQPALRMVHFVFDGPPDPEGPRFVETETSDGRGLGVGEWIEGDGGQWALAVRCAAADVREA